MRTVFIASQLPEMSAIQETIIRYLSAAECCFTGFGFQEQDGVTELERNIQCLKKADLMIVLQGKTYGALSENGVGLVHRLYSQAKALRKPVFCLIEQGAGSSTQSLDDRRVHGFINQLRTQQHAFFEPGCNHIDSASTQLDEFIAQIPSSHHLQASNHEAPKDTKDHKQQIQLLQRSLQQRSREVLDNLVAENRIDPQLLVQYGVKKYQDGNVQIIQNRVRLSWPQIISLIGPCITTPTSDAALYSNFCQRLLEFIHASLVSKYPLAHAFVHLKVKPSDFDRIKAICYSLGIISNLECEWALTPFGTHQMASHQLQTDRSINL